MYSMISVLFCVFFIKSQLKESFRYAKVNKVGSN